MIRNEIAVARRTERVAVRNHDRSLHRSNESRYCYDRLDERRLCTSRRSFTLRLNEEPRFFYWIYRLERKELVIDCIGIRELCC